VVDASRRDSEVLREMLSVDAPTTTPRDTHRLWMVDATGVLGEDRPGGVLESRRATILLADRAASVTPCRRPRDENLVGGGSAHWHREKTTSSTACDFWAAWTRIRSYLKFEEVSVYPAGRSIPPFPRVYSCANSSQLAG